METGEWGALAAALNTIGQVGAAVVNSDGSHRSQWRAYDINKRLADYQNAINIQNWNMQNEYNKPSAQMERLAEAGLNPNLVYGKGADNTASSLPSYQTTPFQSVNTSAPYGDAISRSFSQATEQIMAAVGIQKQIQETKNLGTYQKSMLADISLKRMDFILKRYTAEKTEIGRKYWQEMAEWELLNQKANGQLKFAQRDYIRDWQGPLASSQIDLNTSAELRNDSSRGLIDAQTITENLTRMVKIDVMRSQVAENLSRVGLNNAQVGHVMQMINNAKWDSNIKAATLNGKNLENEINSYLLKHGVNLKGNGISSVINGILFEVSKAGDWLDNNVPFPF